MDRISILPAGFVIPLGGSENCIQRDMEFGNLGNSILAGYPDAYWFIFGLGGNTGMESVAVQSGGLFTLLEM